MRESTGAAWIFSIVITFIMIFTAYLAVSVNYAKAFRIKNHIISIIEDNEGLDEDDLDAFQIDDYLHTSGYAAFGNCNDRSINWEQNDWMLMEDLDIYPNNSGRNGVCIYFKDVVNEDDFCPKRYYRVVTFFRLDIPFFGRLLTFSVKGNSKAIYDLANHPECIKDSVE